MEKDENMHRARKRHEAKGTDEGEVTFKDPEEEIAGEGGTPERQEPRAPSSGDVHMSDPQQQHHDSVGDCEETRGS